MKTFKETFISDAIDESLTDQKEASQKGKQLLQNLLTDVDDLIKKVKEAEQMLASSSNKLAYKKIKDDNVESSLNDLKKSINNIIDTAWVKA